MENNINSNFLKNALSLAYLGDAVFTLMVRSELVKKYDFKTRELNKRANRIVCAKFQAEVIKKIKENLTETEHDVIMRARNAHANNKAKNSTWEEYSLATQFEALVGFWYLNGEDEKLNKMFNEYIVENLWLLKG